MEKKPVCEDDHKKQEEKNDKNNNSNSSSSESVRVVIRVRPLNESEIKEKCVNVWHCDKKQHSIYLIDNKGKIVLNRYYTFDNIILPTEKTKELYLSSINDVVNSVMKGFNGTVFAYGQTSSGKTYTMMGSGKGDDGIIHRAIKRIYASISKVMC